MSTDNEKDLHIIKSQLLYDFVSKVLIKDLAKLVIEYAGFWVDLDEIDNLLDCYPINCIIDRKICSDCIIDQSITSIVFENVCEVNGIETIRRVKLNPGNAPITYFMIHDILYLFMTEWIKFVETSWPGRYNSNGDEYVFPVFKAAEVLGSVMKVPVIIDNMYGIKL